MRIIESKGQKGMSLIEVLVAAGLLGIVVAIIFSVLAQTKRAQRDITDRLKSKQAMDRIMTVVIGASGNFTPFFIGNNVLTYIGCFNRDGLMTPNKRNNQKDFIVTNLKDPSKLPKKMSEICWNEAGEKHHEVKSRFEVHIVPDKDGQNKAKVYAFILDPNMYDKKGSKENKSGQKWFNEVEIEFERSM